MKQNAKETVAEIKKLMKFDAVDVATPTTYKLQDGTEVSIDKLEPGGLMNVAGAVAPDGSYTLEDGCVVVVTAGVIATVTPATPGIDETEMKTPAQMLAALNKFVDAAAGTTPDLSKLVTIVKACFENVFGWELRQAQEKAQRDAAIAIYQQGFAKLNANFTKSVEANNKLVALVEDLMEEDAAPPAEKTKLPDNWNEMTALQRRKFDRQSQA